MKAPALFNVTGIEEVNLLIEYAHLNNAGNSAFLASCTGDQFVVAVRAGQHDMEFITDALARLRNRRKTHQVAQTTPPVERVAYAEVGR